MPAAPARPAPLHQPAGGTARTTHVQQGRRAARGVPHLGQRPQRAAQLLGGVVKGAGHNLPGKGIKQAARVVAQLGKGPGDVEQLLRLKVAHTQLSLLQQ